MLTNTAWRIRRREHLAHEVEHHPPSPAAVKAHETIRAAVLQLGNTALDVCPRSRELDQGLHTLTDEVLSLFNAAIARNHDQLEASDGHPDQR